MTKKTKFLNLLAGSVLATVLVTAGHESLGMGLWSTTSQEFLSSPAPVSASSSQEGAWSDEQAQRTLLRVNMAQAHLGLDEFIDTELPGALDELTERARQDFEAAERHVATMPNPYIMGQLDSITDPQVSAEKERELAAFRERARGAVVPKLVETVAGAVGANNLESVKLLRQLREVQSELVGAKADLARANEEVVRLRQVSQEPASHPISDALQEQVEAAEREKTDVQRKLKKAEKRIRGLEAAIEQKDREINVARTHGGSLPADAAVARNLQDQLDQARKEVQDLAEQHATSLREVSDTGARLAAAEIERNELQARVNDLTVKAGEIEKQVEQRVKEALGSVDAADSRSFVMPIAAHAQALEEVRSQLRVVEGQLLEAYKEQGSLHSRLRDERKKAMYDFTEQLLETQRKYEEELNNWRRLVQTSNKATDEAIKAEVAKVEQAFRTEKEALIADHESALQGLRNDHDAAKEELNTRIESLEKTERDLSQQVAELTPYQAALNDLGVGKDDLGDIVGKLVAQGKVVKKEDADLDHARAEELLALKAKNYNDDEVINALFTDTGALSRPQFAELLNTRQKLNTLLPIVSRLLGMKEDSSYETILVEEARRAMAPAPAASAAVAVVAGGGQTDLPVDPDEVVRAATVLASQAAAEAAAAAAGGQVPTVEAAKEGEKPAAEPAAAEPAAEPAAPKPAAEAEVPKNLNQRRKK